MLNNDVDGAVQSVPPGGGAGVERSVEEKSGALKIFLNFS